MIKKTRNGNLVNLTFFVFSSKGIPSSPQHNSTYRPTPLHQTGMVEVCRRCLGFLVSWFQNILVSWFHSSKDLTNSHFMFSGHIQNSQDFIKRIVGICRQPSFRNLSKAWIFPNEVCKHTIFSNDLGFS